MSDSFSPEDEGPDPYQGQDLDGVLSGADCRNVPEALRPVVPALEALRAAPTGAELRGEAAARAYFREVTLAGGGEQVRTLILPVVAPGGPDAARRPHRHRRPPKRGHWQAKTLAAAAAAAVVIAGAAVVTGTFSSSGGHPAAGSGHRATNATTRATAPSVNGVEGTGTREPTVKPTHAATTSQPPQSGPSRSGLCHEYSDFFTHPGRHSPATEYRVFKQLGDTVYYYCMRELQLWEMPQEPGKFPDISGKPYSAGWPGEQGGQGQQGSQ